MPVAESLAFATLRTLGAGLRAKRFSSVELTEFFLKRTEKWGPQFNAVVRVTRELAFKQASIADMELAAGKDRGPLHGIPYGAKDLLATAGIPTSWGAAQLKEQMLDHDATVITRLRDAGAVLIAKLAMVEIAGGMGYRQANATFTGPGLNPWGRDRWSGGSSSGSAAAVAAGMVPFALGSETWGSIINPAASCGVTGFRPTYGRVSRHGAMALSWTLDKIGPIARTAEDCGLVLNAIAGPDPEDPSATARPFLYPEKSTTEKKPFGPPFKLAMLKGGAKKLQPGVADNFKKSLAVLKSLATCEEITLPEFPYSLVTALILNSEMASAFDGFISSGDAWELTAEEDHWGAYSNLLILAKDYLNAMRIRVQIQKAIDAVMARYDAILTPTLPTVAYPIGKDWSEYRKGYMTNDMGAAGNLCGLPSITIPNGFGEADLPTGIQFVGRAYEEHKLLAIAHAYQQATDWHTKFPKF